MFKYHKSEVLYYDIVKTPLGEILIAADMLGLRHLSFQTSSRRITPSTDWKRDKGKLSNAAQELKAYFAGELKCFTLPIKLDGTDFQLGVWQALQNIPYGETLSYGELARTIGKPKAYRAVGNANNINPIPVIVPCHRVIGSSGKLVGYAGGLEIKTKLLNLEAHYKNKHVE